MKIKKIKIKKIKIKKIIVFLYLIVCSLSVNSQVSISDKDNQQAHPAAVLDLISDDKGFLLPRMETLDRDNISDPAESLMIYNTETQCIEVWIDGWQNFWCIDHPVENPCEGFEGTTYDYEIDYGGYTYKLVEIGNQCWFAENLRYDNGCSSETWIDETDEGWCGCYNDNCAAFIDSYGLLYEWSASMNWNGVGDPPAEGSQGICPEGWRLPSHDDWTMLERSVCSSDTCEDDFPLDNTADNYRGTNEAYKLKSDFSASWCDDAMCGDSGFDAMPGGYRSNINGNFTTGGDYGRWWTSTECETEDDRAWFRLMYKHNTDVPNHSKVFRHRTGKSNAHSVRCVR